MAEITYSEKLVQEEPHLEQWRRLYPGRRLFRGPDPAQKLIPVHNAVMTGRAVNNNSATEMMNVVTMEEILLPILGQLQLMRDQPVLIGKTGEVISVGIGMTVAERFGRVFPNRQFAAGDTAHASGEFAKTLKSHIPCVLAPKPVLARHIIQALQLGMVPGLHLGCSPAVLAVARALGAPIAVDNITPHAFEELTSIGLDREYLSTRTPPMQEQEIIDQSQAIIPGGQDTVTVQAGELAEKTAVRLPSGGS